MSSKSFETPAVQDRAHEYYRAAASKLAANVDRMMAWLLGLEWLGLMGVAFFMSPRTWNGTVSRIHPHLLAAILSGVVIIGPAILLALRFPGRQFTRHAVAVVQMLISSLLIDSTGGRIESHFHIFGSLAFLAFYRDWRVLVTASAVAGADHMVRQVWWPLSIFGSLTVSPLRWLEHVWWVVFEDIFLIAGSLRNTTDMREVALGKSRLYEGAYHDVLTGLANRRLLSEHFENSVAEAPSTSRAVLFLDLDRFKQANDTLGHTVGDKLLTSVGTRLSACLGKEQLLARVGGDEFVVVLNHAGEHMAMDVAGRLLHSLTEPFDIEGHNLLLSASAGISLYPQQGTTLFALQTHADQAMYVAKSKGRNQTSLYSPEVEIQGDNVAEISRDLYQALPKGELHLVFQPLFARGRDLSGFEAFLRWSHPHHGSIPPSVFIPLAERSGLIVFIGEWVLLEACRQCKTWQRPNRPPVRIAVNISSIEFELPDFSDRVKGALQKSGLDPSLLTLELTEGVLIRNLLQTRQQLSGLRRLGVQVALDDFGTGYSSLSYLSELPADTIKLDRSFVHNQYTKRSTILDSVVQMAHRIGLCVVAEGVETSDQAKWLLNLDCDELQGFTFSYPLQTSLVEGYVEACDSGRKGMSWEAEVDPTESGIASTLLGDCSITDLVLASSDKAAHSCEVQV